MSSSVFNEKFRRPSIGFTEMLRKGIGGMLREKDEYATFMFRALVLASDPYGGKLETPDGVPEGKTYLEEVIHDVTGGEIARYTVNPTLGPRNPKNSVRARIITEGMDQFIDDDNLRTFWPLLPGISNPSAGELVYVVFEDERMTHGLWISKVPTDLDEENSNQTLMNNVYKKQGESKNQLFHISGNSYDPQANPSSPNRLTNLFLGMMGRG